MKHLRKTIVGTVAATAISVTAAWTQTVPGARPMQVTPRPSATISAQQRRTPARAVKKPMAFVVIQPQNTLASGVVAAMALAMKDWTPATDGAVIGGPELFQRDGQVFLLATGQDHAVHGVRIDPSTLKPDPSTWTLVMADQPALSGVTCSAQKDGTPAYDPSECSYLTTGGAAFHFFMWDQYGLLSGSSYAKPEGHNAGARPAYILNEYNSVIAGHSSPHKVTVPELLMAVWDGHDKMFVDGANFGDADGYGWDVVPLPALASGLGCDFRCAYRRGDGSAAVVALKTIVTADEPNGAYSAAFKQIGQPTPPLPGAIGTPDLIERNGVTHVFMARAGGGLSYIRGATGVNQLGGAPAWEGWQDLAGMMKLGSDPSCVRYGAGGICAIQGMDGRIYLRRWGGSAGL